MFPCLRSGQSGVGAELRRHGHAEAPGLACRVLFIGLLPRPQLACFLQLKNVPYRALFHMLRPHAGKKKNEVRGLIVSGKAEETERQEREVGMVRGEGGGEERGDCGS